MDRLLVKTLLGRVKGSALDITADYRGPPIYYMALLSPFTQQISNLKLKGATSDQVQDISVAISGPLPLLHTLEINARGYFGGPPSLVTPTLPLFEGATNLSKFVLEMDEFPSLRHFAFPNLTTLDFFAWITEYPVSGLLDFLEASPALRWISIRFEMAAFREDVPLGRVIVLPYVETFYLNIPSYGPSCEIETHISCPFAKHVEFAYRLECLGDNVSEDIYPPSTSLGAIIHQYTEGTVERVVLEVMRDGDFNIECSIAFRSSDGATLKLCYVHYTAEAGEEMEEILEERLPVIFSQAFQTIRGHPLLANIRRLCIRGGNFITHNPKLVAKAVGRLLGSMGPLENLTLDKCDLQPYLDAFLDIPLFPEAIQPTSFPHVKELAIINPVQSFHDEEYATAIVRLARSQHAREVPFERVVLRTTVPTLVIDELVKFVNVVARYVPQFIVSCVWVLHVAYRSGADQQPPGSVNLNTKFVQELIDIGD